MDSALILPGGGTADRSEFWNSIEKHHKRGDAVLVREVEVSLPTELTKEQRKDLAVGYASELADRYGVAADVALHAPRTVTDLELEKNPKQYHETDPETGRRHNGNWHAHIMLSACHVRPDGTLGKKAVELDPIHCQKHRIVNMVERERPRWGDLANAALERHGHDARIDHRSHAERGIEAEPTRHLGPAAASIERRTGEKSEKRVGFEQEVTDRLMRAKEAGQLERESAEVFCSIIDVTMDLNAAKSEQARQRRDENPGKYADGIWGRLETQLRPAAPAQRDSNIEDAIKSYGAWASPSSVSKPLPAAPKAAPDWSQFRAFAGTMASKPLPIQPQGEKAVEKPKEGPEYFPETKEEKTEHDPAAAQQLLREQQAARSNELWEQMEKDQQEREERDRERDSGFDFDR